MSEQPRDGASTATPQDPGARDAGDAGLAEAFLAGDRPDGSAGAHSLRDAPGPYFGRYGGRWMAESLIRAMDELEETFEKAKADPAFAEEFQRLSREYSNRPSLLTEAARLSERAGARIFLKREDLNHTGSHKINNVMGQALLARRMGKTRLIAETGAGQHGVATATAAAYFGMECVIYMGEEDTRRQALNVARMPTVDEEFLGAAKDFIGRQARASRPFFVWFNSTRMHIFTHLKKESLGKTGKGIHADGMVEHDGMVGELLKQLDDLGIADNTIVLYTTDNGAEIALWPDGAMTPFKGEKGTTWEGGMRIPMMVRWPGVVKPGTQYNDIISLIDWFPTLCAAAGIPDIKERMKTGFQAGGKTFKVHLDGYNFMPFFKGDEQKGPRDSIYYFDQGGNLNAIRWNDWKLSFATAKGNIATGVRETPAWALIANLRMDPYERGMDEGGGAVQFLAQNMWLIVPVQGKVKEFFSDFDQFPYQSGSSLNAGGINYGLLRQQDAMRRLKELESIKPN